ncbi:hypothetical protein UlMin_009042 [Ulmus minor]
MKGSDSSNERGGKNGGRGKDKRSAQINVVMGHEDTEDIHPFYPPLTLRTPVGGYALVSFVCKSCSVMIESHRLLADLIVLPMTQFDVILGINWLSKYRTIIDCHQERVIIGTEDSGIVTYQANQGNLRSLGYINAISCELEPVGKHSYIMVVDKYPDVFSDELPGLPPKRGIKFCIDLILGTSPVSISPYHTANTEMMELRKQLQELLDRGFIRPSTSPWGAPILFAKNMMVRCRYVLIIDS